jgi:hypothetical protein
VCSIYPWLGRLAVTRIAPRPSRLLVPDLPRLNRLNRERLVRLHLPHRAHELLGLFPRVEHQSVIKLSCPHLVTLPNGLRHRFASVELIELPFLATPYLPKPSTRCSQLRSLCRPRPSVGHPQQQGIRLSPQREKVNHGFHSNLQHLVDPPAC